MNVQNPETSFFGICKVYINVKISRRSSDFCCESNEKVEEFR